MIVPVAIDNHIHIHSTTVGRKMIEAIIVTIQLVQRDRHQKQESRLPTRLSGYTQV
jgi:hypothetical protein